MRAIVLGVAALAASGCGDDGATIDATVDAAPRCNTQKMFGTPVLLESLSSDFDDAMPRLFPDELGIVFGRKSAAGNFDLWPSARPKTIRSPHPRS